ncbi:hypothetical protein [Ensifer sp. B1-9]|uniref:hypothetical protein n=1 Tax=Ensifer sp. B1-9 TaxID=3141455 RepID=UPI003D1F6E03
MSGAWQFADVVEGRRCEQPLVSAGPAIEASYYFELKKPLRTTTTSYCPDSRTFDPAATTTEYYANSILIVVGGRRMKRTNLIGLGLLSPISEATLGHITSILSG